MRDTFFLSLLMKQFLKSLKSQEFMCTNEVAHIYSMGKAKLQNFITDLSAELGMVSHAYKPSS